MYPGEWKGNATPADKSGSASFTVEGETFCLQLESFTDYQDVSRMLELAFRQGKSFAAKAMRSHVERAMRQAEIDHAL
jgi:hypothetical protein